MEKAIAYKKDQATGQMALFTTFTAQTSNEPYQFTSSLNWNNRETLEKEKEVIGFYLSSHPLDMYRQHMTWFNPQPLQVVRELAQKHHGEHEFTALICGLLKSRKDIITKKGDRMAFIQLEDGENSAEVVLFPKTFSAVEQWLNDYRVFLISGAIDITDPKILKIKANKMIPVELVLQEWQPIAYAILELPQQINDQLIATVAKTFIDGSIVTALVFHDQGKKLRLKLKQKIALDENIMVSLEKMGIHLQIGL
jgi:DNA polymerase-3 subunit alpha